ncbi:hypothetical protein [Prauserella muralis]|uniref:hypothetical protein n=1 Tax=Prauserella muralis TaxID=588067 RepID=UPI0011ADC21A|nr:hypothetical protein [Prauserella muralis]TWE29904.1 hypothetical protein FHX69_2596 [Prauserella muralis]
MTHLVRSVLSTMDAEARHAFATAYAAHVDSTRAAGREPLTVTAAAQRWHTEGAL